MATRDVGAAENQHLPEPVDPPPKPLPPDNANAAWTPSDEAIMLNHLIKLKSKAGEGCNFQTKHFRGALDALNKNRTKGGLKTAKSAKQKFTTLKKTFDIIQDIQSKSGWTWTNKNGANIGYGLTAASGTWDAYVKAIPAAERFKNAGWVNLALMEELMGVRIAKGSHVFRASQAFVIPDGDEASSDKRAGSLPWDMENPNYNDGADGVDDGDRTGANDDDGAGGNDDKPEEERRSSSPSPFITPAAGKKRRAATPTPTPFRKKTRLSGADALANIAATAAEMVDVLGGFRAIFAADAASAASAPAPAPALPTVTSSSSADLGFQATPHRRHNAIMRAQKLETWLCDADIVILIDILRADISKADTYNALERPSLRVAWVQSQLREAMGIETGFDTSF
ncbi:hypothetical protein C8J57DRAFT_1506015 [Mycena rebaudengoi]|nr:hypothetical protein C8J57DRAFT_1506015 [Mycena rebaudengoi]